MALTGASYWLWLWLWLCFGFDFAFGALDAILEELLDAIGAGRQAGKQAGRQAGRQTARPEVNLEINRYPAASARFIILCGVDIRIGIGIAFSASRRVVNEDGDAKAEHNSCCCSAASGRSVLDLLIYRQPAGLFACLPD